MLLLRFGNSLMNFTRFSKSLPLLAKLLKLQEILLRLRNIITEHEQHFKNKYFEQKI